jgi:hypothetical protein
MTASRQGVRLQLATIIEKLALKLAARVLSLGRMVQWKGVLVVERDCWVGLAVGLSTSVVWVGGPVEHERVREAMGEVLVGLGWLIVKQ